MNKVLAILMGVLLLSPLGAVAAEDQAGLRYWNKINKDAIATSSGLQFKALITGKGRKPVPSDRGTVHYRGGGPAPPQCYPDI